MLEKSVKTAALGWLNSLPNSHWWSNPVSKYGISGRPDIEGVWESFYIGIECKTPAAFKKKDQGRTKAQSDWMRSVHAADGICVTVSTLADLKTGLKDALDHMRLLDHPDQDERTAA